MDIWLCRFNTSIFPLSENKLQSAHIKHSLGVQRQEYVYQMFKYRNLSDKVKILSIFAVSAIIPSRLRSSKVLDGWSAEYNDRKISGCPSKELYLWMCSAKGNKADTCHKSYKIFWDSKHAF